MPLNEIRVREKGDVLEVDFWPGMKVDVVERDVAPRRAPEVRVDVGVVQGRKVPIVARYPKSAYTAEDIMERADRLIEKTRHCSDCERRRREVLAKINETLGRPLFAPGAPPAGTTIAAPAASVSPPPASVVPPPARRPSSLRETLAARAAASGERLAASVREAAAETQATARALLPPLPPTPFELLAKARERAR